MKLNKPKYTDEDFDLIMREFAEIVYETVRQFPQMSAAERQQNINEMFAFAENSKRELVKHLFRSIGNY